MLTSWSVPFREDTCPDFVHAKKWGHQDGRTLHWPPVTCSSRDTSDLKSFCKAVGHLTVIIHTCSMTTTLYLNRGCLLNHPLQKPHFDH